MKKIINAVFFFLVFNQFALATPPVEAYGHLPGVEMIEISPSGTRYAFIAVVGEARRLVVATDKGEAIFAAEVGNLKTRKIDWVGDDRILLCTSSTFDHRLDFVRAYELSSVVNIDLKTHKISTIFGNTKKIANVVLGNAGVAHVDGHPYGYFVGLAYEWDKGAQATPGQNGYVFQRDNRNLYQVDLETNEASLLARGGEGSSYSWAVETDGKVVAHSEYNEHDGIWRLYAGEDHVKLLLEKQSPLRRIHLLGRGRTPNTVWISDSSSGLRLTQEISASDGKTETLFSDVSPNEYLIDPDSGQAIGATTLEEPHAVFFDAKLQARMKGTRKAFPDLQMSLISYSHNLDRLIVKTDAGNDSGTYWLVDIATGKADPIGHPYPEVRAADVGPTQWINYKAADGLDIHAVLTLPPGRKPENLPLVVLPHGGPIGVNDFLRFDWWAQAYASSGYAVLQPNYRGSGGVSKEFELAGYGQWGRKMQTDLSDGVAALASQGVINPKRVCIVGGSYGGYAALAGITMQQGIYRCAVSVGGLSDLQAFFNWQVDPHHYETEATRFWRAVTGADKEGNGVMKTLSPAYFAEQASGPILLIHGKDDTVVPIEQSRLMASALRSANKAVEILEMKGEDHWLSRDETRKTMLKAAVAFVREHNPPD